MDLARQVPDPQHTVRASPGVARLLDLGDQHFRPSDDSGRDVFERELAHARARGEDFSRHQEATARGDFDLRPNTGAA